jgi:hypothetical protein
VQVVDEVEEGVRVVAGSGSRVNASTAFPSGLGQLTADERMLGIRRRRSW